MRRLALLVSSALLAAGAFVIGFHLGVTIAHVADAADDEDEYGQGQRSGGDA